MQPDWRPPDHWIRVTAVDSHSGGEPFRVITGGLPEAVGHTMLERRRFAAEHLDAYRRALIWEPRGHADMYGCLLTPPVSPASDLGVLFLHNAGFSTMCGHGVIALVTVALETGMLAGVGPTATVRLDTPAGPVTATATLEEGRVRRVAFRNVPSFAVELGASVEVNGLGEVRFDLAFGGAFYAFVRAADLGLGCSAADLPRLVSRAAAIKAAVASSRRIEHPVEPDLGFLYGVIFIGDAVGADAHSRHVCVFADGEVDRSPTGTGVSARLAVLDARGELDNGEEIAVESVVGSRFTGRVAERTRCGSFPAVVPEVEGAAHITGLHEFLLDPRDDLGKGFLLR